MPLDAPHSVRQTAAPEFIRRAVYHVVGDASGTAGTSGGADSDARGAGRAGAFRNHAWWRHLERSVRRRSGSPDQGERKPEVMIEVKLSHEESKAGAEPESLAGLLGEIRACANLELTGLMTMPPGNDDPEITRPYFRRLAALAREHGLKKLSMGMSHDLEAPIEEDSRHVRVGTALFGPRVK